MTNKIKLNTNIRKRIVNRIANQLAQKLDEKVSAILAKLQKTS